MHNSLRSEVGDFISRVAGLRVDVIGETIIDEFIEVVYEGHSMKSFCPVFRLDEKNPKLVQQGGAAAIAGHLRDFVKHVELISNTNNEIVKTRYIDAADPRTRLALEFDGAGTHSEEVDRLADLERDAALVSIGYTPLHFTFQDLMYNQEWCRQAYRAARAARLLPR